MFLLICTFVERMNIAANAIIAKEAEAARLLLATQALQKCIQQNDPRGPGNTWLGIVPQQAQWAPDPCQNERDTVAQMQEQTAADSNVPALQNLQAAPAPQLATTQDPVPAQDPMIPESEFTAPDPGINNMFSPQLPGNLEAMILGELGEDVDQEMRDQVQDLLNATRVVRMWCPWGGPGTWNLKLIYKPKNERWLGKWIP